jgi:hypothetical protein
VLALAERALWLLAVVTVVLIAASILVAARRGRAVLVVALGTAATLVLVRSSARAVVDAAPDLTDNPGAKAAIEAFLGNASESLLRVTGVVLLVAFMTVVVTLLVGHWRRDDLVLTAAVAVGAITTAAIGVGSWGLVIGLAVGIAVPFVVNWLSPVHPPAGRQLAAVAADQPVASPASSVADPGVAAPSAT